jgi:hypothetical protein
MPILSPVYVVHKRIVPTAGGAAWNGHGRNTRFAVSGTGDNVK